MSTTNLAFVAFNRGRVSRLGQARQDVKRIGMSADVMTNFVPRVLGSMSIRPGLEFVGETSHSAYGGAIYKAYFIPFVFSNSDAALLEFNESYTVLPWINDAPVTLPSVTTQIVNGGFAGSLVLWTIADEAGAVSAHGTANFIWPGSVYINGLYPVADNCLQLLGNGTASAITYQLRTVATEYLNIEHILYVRVGHGPVEVRVGSTLHGVEYFDYSIGTGYHLLAFTPTTANLYVEFRNKTTQVINVHEVSIFNAAGKLFLINPYAASDIANIRWEQSADVMYLACDGYIQAKIERRALHSWSIVQYIPEDGPFRIENLDPNNLMSSGGATTGYVHLQSTLPVWQSTHAGSLWGITSQGQGNSAALVASNTFNPAPIKITGVGTDRDMALDISGVWTGTLTLQRSLTSDVGPWTDVANYVVNTSATYNDALDNQIAWYQLGFKAAAWLTGSATVLLNYAGGNVPGTVWITTVTDSTHAIGYVLKDLGSTAATSIWAEPSWSDYRGWPSSVALHEGRLGWSGRGETRLSVSDGYESYDATVTGDSGPIDRTIGSGPVDTINWMMSLQRLLLGTDGREASVQSSVLGDPLTPTNTAIRSGSSQGSASVAASKIDNRAVFVQRGGTRIFELGIDNLYYGEYQAKDLTALIPEIGQPEIVRMAVQRQPDTRIHCVRSDGTVALAVYDKNEDVLGWMDVETTGSVVDVVVLPGDPGSDEDKVYYVVERTILGISVYYLEKWAKQSECTGV